MKAALYTGIKRGLNRFMLCSSLVLASQYAAAEGDAAKASAYYESALKYYNSEKFDEAVIELKNAFQENPKFLPALVLLGKAYLETGKPTAAESAFSDAIELGADPSLLAIPLNKAYLMQFKHDLLLAQKVDETLPANTKLELHLLRARAALETNNRPALNLSLSAAEELDPLAAELLALKATLMMRSGKLEQAEELTNRLKDIYPKNTTAWLTDASLKHIQGDSKGALEGYGKVIELNPNRSDARIARIGLLMDLNLDPNSEGDFTVLSESAHYDPRVSYLRAVTLAKAGDEFGSSTALNETLNLLDALGPEIFTRNLQLLMVAAIANYSLNNLESARDYLEVYVEASPNELAPQRVLANVYMRQGEFRNATSILEKMRALRPNDPGILSLLAQAYDSAGNHKQSILTFENALNQSGDDPQLKTQLAISKMNAGFLEQGMSELNSLFLSEQQQTASGMALAVTLLNQQRFDEALVIARKLAEQHPEDISKQNLLAIALVGTGELNEAKSRFTTLLETAPDNVSVQRNLAKIELQQQNYAAAKAILDRLIKASPDNPQLMLEMAQLFHAQNNLSEALRWAKSAAAAAPKSFTINSYLIDLYIESGELQQALKLSLDQEAIHEGNLHAQEAQAKVLAALQERKQLLSLLRRMATEADFNTQWLLKIARYQVAADSLEEASYTLFRGLQGNPGHFETKVMLTDIEIQLDRLEPAMERAKQLIDDFPDRPAGYMLVGDVRMKRGQFSDAIPSYTRALELGKNTGQLLSLHIALRTNNQDDQAESILVNWLSENSQDRVAQNALAEFYLSKGRYADAVRLYQTMVEQPNVAPAFYNNLSYALYKQGQLDEAISYARKAYALVPNAPLINDTLGWLLVENNTPAEALPFLREAVTRASANPEIRYHLAVALHALGRNKEALAELRTAIKSATPFEGHEQALTLLEQLEQET